jgi:2-polyprenyl-6-methoxyphenol hydroxylase-like FAD-dependent oxidoreductase
MAPQFLTEGVMRGRLAELGQRVEYGSELVGFTQDTEGVTARVKNVAGERTIHARYLVGADGALCAMRSISVSPARPSACAPSSPT